MTLKWAGREHSLVEAAPPTDGAVCLLFADFTSAASG